MWRVQYGFFSFFFSESVEWLQGSSNRFAGSIIAEGRCISTGRSGTYKVEYEYGDDVSRKEFDRNSRSEKFVFEQARTTHRVFVFEHTANKP